ncbi:MAG: LptF/LptG family permease [Acidobacteriota bacterium]
MSIHKSSTGHNSRSVGRFSWRLCRATIGEAVPYIGLTFLILTTLVFIQQLGRYTQVVLSFQASAEATTAFMLSLLPGIVVITLPVSLVLGTVITCSRQSADNELTVAQACGVDQRMLGLPFLLLGLAGTLITLYLTTEVAPSSLRQLKALRSRILLQEATLQIKPHLFITTFPNLLLYVQDVDERTGDWLGVFILQQERDGGGTRVVTAQRGRLRLANEAVATSSPYSIEAELFQGVSYESTNPLLDSRSPGVNLGGGLPVRGPDDPGTLDVATASDFQRASIRLVDRSDQERTVEGGFETPGALSEMTLAQLGRQALRAVNPLDRRRAQVEWHKRLAFPFACLTLTCITFLVALRGKRFSTRPRTVVAILFVALAFYLLLVAGQNLASSGRIAPWLGVWFSNLLLGAYILLLARTNKGWIALPGESFVEFVSLRFGRLSRWMVRVSKRDDQEEVDPSSVRFKSVRFSLINLINYLIVSEILKYFLLALLALIVTSITFTLFDLIPALSKSSMSAGYALGYLLYLTPQFGYYVAPFATMVAILAGCSVLARSNQFVVLSAAGLGRNRIASTIVGTAVLLAILLWAMSDYLLPVTNREQDLRYHRIKNKQLEQTTIAFGRKWVFGRNNTIYSYQRIESDNSLLNATVYRLSGDRRLLESSVFFNRAEQTGEREWRVIKGRLEMIRPDLTIARASIGDDSAGARDHFKLTIEDGAGLFKRTVNQSTKMSSGDLQSYITQLRAVGIDSTELDIDLHKRLAFPFSCLTLAVLAIPFATTRRARRSSPILSVTIGVAISLLLWLLMTVFESAGKQSSLPVAVSVWGPQILFLAIGVFLNAREARM